jgi:predicted DNA-binding transcriptional regulator AlpA
MVTLFQVSRLTIYNWVERGVLPPPVKIGGANLWIKSEIDKKRKDMEDAREMKLQEEREMDSCRT